MKKAFVIFSGFNQRAVIAFLRTALRLNVPCYIIAFGKNDPIFRTAYSNLIYDIREPGQFSVRIILPVLSKLLQEQSLDELVILPSTEYLNRVLLNERELLKLENITVPLVSKDLYETISDKASFRTICSEHGLLIPEEIDFNQHLALPIVVKPKRYFSKDGSVQHKPQLIFTEKQFQKCIETQQIEELFFERFITGDSFYLLFYISRNESSVCYSQKNLIQQEKGGSIIAAISADIHKKEISNQYQELFKKLGFWGLIMVELRYSEGRYYLIEANPRLWGPSQLFVDANVPIFDNYIKDLGFEPRNLSNSLNSETNKYFWLGGLDDGNIFNPSLAFYGTDRESFADGLEEYLKVDIYKRKDTASIFEIETQTSPK